MKKYIKNKVMTEVVLIGVSWRILLLIILRGMDKAIDTPIVIVLHSKIGIQL
jgi:hypothetical protein